METSYVMAKGQLVVPARIRRKFEIKEGARVNFVEEKGRIILQPVTRDFIESVCGMLKRKPGSKPVTQQLIEEHAVEVLRDQEPRAKHRV